MCHSFFTCLEWAARQKRSPKRQQPVEAQPPKQDLVRLIQLSPCYSIEASTPSKACRMEMLRAISRTSMRLHHASTSLPAKSIPARQYKTSDDHRRAPVSELPCSDTRLCTAVRGGVSPNGRLKQEQPELLHAQRLVNTDAPSSGVVARCNVMAGASSSLPAMEIHHAAAPNYSRGGGVGVPKRKARRSSLV